MNEFRDFELGRWKDAGVCTSYQDLLGPLVIQSVDPLLDSVRLDPADTLLDVATGAGTVAAAAAVRGARVTGLDFSTEQLRMARAAHPGLEFVEGDAGALPNQSGDVDVVVSNFGVPHFPDPEAFFTQSLRVLRPGGRLGFTTWAAPEFTKAYEAILSAVQQHGTFEVGLPAGPNMFLYADRNRARESLTGLGFERVEVITVAQVWDVAHPAEVFLGLSRGTARTAALLQLQMPTALEKIRRAVVEKIEIFRSESGRYLVPMPAVLVSGTKP